MLKIVPALYTISLSLLVGAIWLWLGVIPGLIAASTGFFILGAAIDEATK